MHHRLPRVNSLIKEELGKIFIREMEFPEMLVTITEVETSRNMNQAMVRISVIPSPNASEALKIINQQSNHLRYLLAEKTEIKPMPKIIFEIDHGPEKAARVEELLRKE